MKKIKTNSAFNYGKVKTFNHKYVLRPIDNNCDILNKARFKNKSSTRVHIDNNNVEDYFIINKTSITCAWV